MSEAKCDSCGAPIGDYDYETDLPAGRGKYLHYSKLCVRCGKKAFRKQELLKEAKDEG